MTTRDQGFTLIELLVAITLLAALVLPVAARLTAAGSRAHSRLDLRMTAQRLLRSMLSEHQPAGSADCAVDTLLPGGERFRLVRERLFLEDRPAHRFLVLKPTHAGWDTCAVLIRREPPPPAGSH